MRYLYDIDHELDPAPLTAMLGQVPHTPCAEVVAAHLSRQGKVHPDKAVA